jgi:hypothetical protein
MTPYEGYSSSLRDRVAAYTRRTEFLATLQQIRNLPETTDCPEEER